jgi:hypothetical protein
VIAVLGLALALVVALVSWTVAALARRSRRSAELYAFARQRRGAGVAYVVGSWDAPEVRGSSGKPSCLLFLENRSPTADAEEVTVRVDTDNGAGVIDYGTTARLKASGDPVQVAMWRVAAPADGPPFVVLVEWADGRRRRHSTTLPVTRFSG